METDHIHLKYFKKISHTVNSLLKKSSDELGYEDYHKLRVEIKKLYAFLDAVKFCSQEFKQKKHFKIFQKIFKQSGKVREFQLEETLLRKYKQHSLEHYLSDLQRRIKNEEKIVALFVSHERKKIKASFREIESHIGRMGKEKVNDFIEYETNNINELLQRVPLQPDQLHELRKLLKKDLYNRKCFGLEKQDNLLQKENSLQELLGKWHDCLKMNNQLEKSIMEEEIDPTEIPLLLKIDAEISLNAEHLLQEINKALGENIFFYPKIEKDHSGKLVIAG